METASQLGIHKTIRKSFAVTGMTCAGCAVSVESVLKSATGVTKSEVNFANQTVWVDYDESTTSAIELQRIIQAAGYDLIIDKENTSGIQQDAHLKKYREIKYQTSWASVLSVPVFLIGMFFMNLPYGSWISMALTATVLFYFGRNFFINAWKQATHQKANMDTLVALSTGIAFLFSAFNTIYPEFWHRRGMHPHVYYEAAAIIIAFISLGKLLEEKAKSNTSSAIKKLMGLQPKTVLVVVNGTEKEVPIASVSKGNVIVLRSGEKVAVDGLVTSGSSYINESTITGEPVPVLKQPGDQVFAGTINQKNSLHYTAQQVGAETLLAQIISMVQQAQGSKAPMQKLVDKIAAIFVPAVIGISIITFITWMLLGGHNAFTHAMLTSVTVLIIACPCALGLATPTAIMVGVGKGAENNILIKDAESLQLARNVNAVVLDKTGTLTEGKPIVNYIEWNVSDLKISILKSILYSLEMQSEHPLAQAVTQKLKEDHVQDVTLNNFESISGKGVLGSFAGHTYFVGNQNFVEQQLVTIHAHIASLAKSLQKSAHTIVYFANEEQVLAIIAITDKVKAGAKAAIKTLQDMNIDVFMLTGDTKQTAAAVAEEIGISNYKAAVLPFDKAKFVKELQAKGKCVAMVGDGINDAHALAQADVSIAMGKGSDIAMDVAKITLITSDLQAIPKALVLSKKTISILHQNLFWAFVYNVIGIPVAAGALYAYNGFLLNPMIAGAAMALSSVSVVANSLRLKGLKL